MIQLFQSLNSLKAAVISISTAIYGTVSVDTFLQRSAWTIAVLVGIVGIINGTRNWFKKIEKDMKLKLSRTFYGEKYTIGALFIDDVYFCDTLEDIPREIKVMNETCIPKGTYKVILNKSIRFNRVMPLLLNVPGFDGIRIHAGNTAADTSGCILVGKNSEVGRLTESRETFNKLFSKLTSADKIEIVVE